MKNSDKKPEKKKFKLVLGLGNNSLEQIFKLCGIYALAGANIFDLSPNIESLKAAKEGILAVGLNPKDFKFCISLGLKGDKHIKKALINESKCKKCFKCVNICPQDAIFKNNEYPKVDWSKCIGCNLCAKSCIGSCFSFMDVQTDLKKVINEFRHEQVDMVDIVELHISSDKKADIIKNWKYILKNFACQKSICIDRSKYGNEKQLELIKELISMNPDRTIIQADGVAMSGSSNLSSTLQAVAHAQLYNDLDAEIFISGGTNIYTKKLAQDMDIRFSGITIGSFARNVLKDTIEIDMAKTLEIARGIVDSVVTN